MNVELIGRAAHVIRNEEPGVNALLTAVEIIHQIPVGRLNDNLSINVFDSGIPRHPMQCPKITPGLMWKSAALAMISSRRSGIGSAVRRRRRLSAWG